jgi:hypothetical protein
VYQEYIKRTVSSENGIEKTDKIEIYPPTYIIHKNNLKWIKDINIRSESSKILDENKEKLSNIGFDNDFVKVIQVRKARIDKLVYIKLNTCILYIANIRQNNKTTYEVGENTCKPYICQTTKYIRNI